MTKKSKLLLAGLLVLALLVISGVLFLTLPVSGQLRQLETAHEIKISADEVVLPPAWEGYVTKVSEVPWYGRSFALRKLEADLSRYPATFLSDALEHVYIFEEMELAGRPYGGTTYGPDGRLYISVWWLGDEGRSPEAMGFHHELSSLLLYRFPELFDQEAWEQLNPPDFDYLFHVSSHQNLDQEEYLGLSGDDGLYRKGFIAPYGMLTLEDDVNTFAQYFFGKQAMLKDLVRRYPTIAAKVEVFSDFIDRINAAQQ